MISKAEIDLASQAHPILKLLPDIVQPLYFGQVEKISTKCRVQNRPILITNVGIFILAKRVFPPSYRSSKIIQYSKLTQILISKLSDHPNYHYDDLNNGNGATPDNIVLTFRLIKTESKHADTKDIDVVTTVKDAGNMIAIIQFVYTLLFPKAKDILAESTPTSVRDQINQSQFLYEPVSTMGDRFLALCLKDYNSPEFKDSLMQLHSQLTHMTVEAVFSSEMLTNVFIEQFTEAIAMSQSSPSQESPFTVCFEQGNWIKVSKCLKILIQDCTFMQTLILKDVNYNTQEKAAALFSSQHQTSLNCISFDTCNLSFPNFKAFLTDLMQYHGKIATFEILDSDIDQHHLQQVFNTIFDAQCFRLLSTLSFSGIKKDIELNIMMFLGSNFVLSNKSVETICVNDSELAIENVLANISLFETGLKNLLLTNCRFNNPLQIDNFQQLEMIDLSGSSFTANSLLSFFKSISVASDKTQNSPSRIHLNNIHIDPSEAHQFYKSISDGLVLPSLISLSYTHNVISNEAVKPFFSFLKKQPNLCELDLSYSLHLKLKNAADNGNDKALTDAFKIIADDLAVLKLEVFKMQGKADTSYKGTYFGKVLAKFLKVNKKLPKGYSGIREIDLYGQQLMDDGLNLLKSFVEEDQALRSISFQSTNASANVLFDLMEIIVSPNSAIETATWPDKDFTSSISKLPTKTRVQAQQKMESIKKQYEKKFGPITPSLQSNSHSSVVFPSPEEFNERPKSIMLNNSPLDPNRAAKKEPFPRRGTVRHPLPSSKNLNGGDKNANEADEKLNTRRRSTVGSDFDYEGILSMKEPEIEKMLVECLGPGAHKMDHDPFIVALRNIQNETALPSA